MKKLTEPYFRFNTRITKEHRDFIKKYSKAKKLTEGTVLRSAMDMFMEKTK